MSFFFFLILFYPPPLQQVILLSLVALKPLRLSNSSRITPLLHLRLLLLAPHLDLVLSHRLRPLPSPRVQASTHHLSFLLRPTLPRPPSNQPTTACRPAPSRLLGISLVLDTPHPQVWPHPLGAPIPMPATAPLTGRAMPSLVPATGKNQLQH